MKYQEKECAICGTWFLPQHANAKYCESCRKHSKRNIQKIQRYMIQSISRCDDGVTHVKQEQFENICKYCGKSFISSGRPLDFCNSTCATKNKIDHTFCCVCGKPMSETNDQRNVNGHNWYCSDACKKKAQWNSAKKNGKVRICPNCGKEHIKSSTYCSKDCYLEHLHKNATRTQQLKASGMKICPVCGRAFKGTSAFCSEQCEEVQKRMEPHAMRTCEICGKTFSCPASEMLHPLCSSSCKEQFQKIKAEWLKKGGVTPIKQAVPKIYIV